MLLKTMLKEDYDKWTVFRENKTNKLTQLESELVAELHSKYKNHSYYIPCTCSPKTWNQWIANINELHDNSSFE